jgi:hypothetical protein
MGRLTPRVMKRERRMVLACILMFVVERLLDGLLPGEMFVQFIEF